MAHRSRRKKPMPVRTDLAPLMSFMLGRFDYEHEFLVPWRAYSWWGNLVAPPPKDESKGPCSSANIMAVWPPAECNDTLNPPVANTTGFNLSEYPPPPMVGTIELIERRERKPKPVAPIKICAVVTSLENYDKEWPSLPKKHNNSLFGFKQSVAT